MPKKLGTAALMHRILQFDVVQLICFWFCFLCFLCQCQEVNCWKDCLLPLDSLSSLVNYLIKYAAVISGWFVLYVGLYASTIVFWYIVLWKYCTDPVLHSWLDAGHFPFWGGWLSAYPQPLSLRWTQTLDWYVPSLVYQSQVQATRDRPCAPEPMKLFKWGHP